MMERYFVIHDHDVGVAAVASRLFAQAQGLGNEKADCLATAISELARNIYKYAGSSGGDILINVELINGLPHIWAQARDNGPGIADCDQAMRDHFSTSGTLGLGLPGVRRIVDYFDLFSLPGKGTVVTIGMALPT
jgi:serine/threonine-protein kinase RsbT